MKNAAIAAKSAALPKIAKELLDQFVSGPMTGEAVNAASMAFKKAVLSGQLDVGALSVLSYAAKFRPSCPLDESECRRSGRGRDEDYSPPPPHRSVRAALPHTAPALSHDAKRSLGYG